MKAWETIITKNSSEEIQETFDFEKLENEEASRNQLSFSLTDDMEANNNG